ncbi:hypothetical protein [Sulfuricurvum sp.]|uniref:hypothetical protein n=1 Tax=Sulfuricurvum sp. TaxID=2025608 RepID=UPI0035681829
MKRKIGNTVFMNEDALENYGNGYKDKPLTITHIATKYMPSKQFFAEGKPKGYHPGYDESVSPMALYDFEELEFSLYEWEIA